MGKPRIRTVKPEFWTDAKIAELPKATALFFIALWNFADDQGIFEDDSRSLALRIPIYRSQDIEKMLTALWRAGLIKRSRGDGLSMVTHWEHQKIDRPRDGKWKHKEINWMTWCDSSKVREESLPVPYRTVSDSKGKDHATLVQAPEMALAEPVDLKALEDSKEARLGRLAKTFIARYCELFKERWKASPQVQGKDAGIAKRVLKDMPLERAVLLLEAYFQLPDAWVIKQKHPLALFQTKLNEIVVFANTGEFTTLLQSRQQEKTQTTVSQLQRIQNGDL